MIINIKRTSMQHVALQYLKMKRSFVTASQLYNFAPDKYRRRHRSKDALDKLVDQGFALRLEDCYTITEQGELALRLIVNQQHRKFYQKEL